MLHPVKHGGCSGMWTFWEQLVGVGKLSINLKKLLTKLLWFFSQPKCFYVLYKNSLLYSLPIDRWTELLKIARMSLFLVLVGLFLAIVVGVVCEVASCAAEGAGSTWGVKRGWEWDLAAASSFRVWGSLARLIGLAWAAGHDGGQGWSWEKF